MTASGAWRRRTIRGAPVGRIDSAPVLLTEAVQVKVYAGEGAEPGIEWRALEALRSVNDVEPVVGVEDAIPAAPEAVLEGRHACEP